MTEITPSSGTHPTGFQDPESQIALFKHEWMSTNTEYADSGTRIRNIKVWDVTDIQLPKLTFDGYNKLTLKGLDSDATSNVTFDGNTYSIGSATDIYIENAGTYDAEINSANSFALTSNVVGAVASTQKSFDKKDQVLDAGTDAGYSNGDASQGGFGNSMDMSADGTRIVVGNVHYTDANGRVWLYHLENGSWVLKQTWDGGTQLGSQVAMNEAGTRAFAVRPTGVNSTVRIWNYSSGAWDTSASGTY